MKSYHFKQDYNVYGTAFLALVAITLYVLAYTYNIMGAANLVILLLLLGVFVLGFLTGRPCLIITKQFFQYRQLPFSRLHLIEQKAISKISFDEQVILLNFHNYKKPFKIKLSSFSREQLPVVIEYFRDLAKNLD